MDDQRDRRFGGRQTDGKGGQENDDSSAAR